ncbi:MAG TPA: N-acetyltransferase family protein [Miltoncostaeaceae bacterium]|nr:N-acetyltransferase family protein [Miltoncostaeaceae bacterium]
MTEDDPEIGVMRQTDWPCVAEIFAEGIATGDSTFETELPTWERWDRDHLAEPRLVARIDGRIVGWGAANRTSIRDVYRGVAEVSVYVAREARGAGVGEPLLTALAEAAHDSGLWTLEAVVLDGNAASARMLESCGFRLVGRRERIGELRGRWRDVLLYERRRARD